MAAKKHWVLLWTSPRGQQSRASGNDKQNVKKCWKMLRDVKRCKKMLKNVENVKKCCEPPRHVV